MTATVNRDALAWAIGAVLPHVGSRTPYDSVNLHTHKGQLYVWAMDGYTAGVARIPLLGGELDMNISIPTTGVRNGEAGALEKFIRIGPVADKDHDVVLAWQLRDFGYDKEHGYVDAELHVGLAEHGEPVLEDDTRVFWQRPMALRPNTDGWKLLASTLQGWQERLGVETREYTFNPKLLSRFQKAGRDPADRLRIYPYAYSGDQGDITYSILTVGKDFLGAIAGQTQEEGIKSILETFDEAFYEGYDTMIYETEHVA